MAIYRFSVQVISRRQGRGVIAAAAYRAGAKLYDERLGLTMNFERKLGVVHTEILAPEGVPTWTYDRAELWNQVERSEARCDARLAREVQIALPAELSHEQQLELLRNFVRSEFVELGMVADFAIHREDDANPHAHVMLTTRLISGEGFGAKERLWNDKRFLYYWRERWEEYANQALA